MHSQSQRGSGGEGNVWESWGGTGGTGGNASSRIEAVEAAREWPSQGAQSSMPGRVFGYVYESEKMKEPPLRLVTCEAEFWHREHDSRQPQEWETNQGPYQLRPDRTVPRGWSYVRRVEECEMAAVEESLRGLGSLRGLDGTLRDGRLEYAIQGMTEAKAGIPYRVEYPDACLSGSTLVPVETRLCVHTLTTLDAYPGGNQLPEKCRAMLRACMGEQGQRPLWHHLGRNSRSNHPRGVPRGDPGYWDGTYSLALTVAEGQGAGTLQVASQPGVERDPTAQSRLATVLRCCSEVALFALRATLSHAEWTALNHLQDRNNVHGFGGSMFTGLQLNVSSGEYGRLKDSLGFQGGLHLDVHDDPAGYTVFVFCVQHSTAGTVDRGAFAFPQSQLFTAEQDHALAIIVMKGRELHGGSAHRLLSDGRPGTIASADGIPELFTERNQVWRLGFICYPSLAAYRRTIPSLAFPSSAFGGPSGDSVPRRCIAGSERLYRTRADMVEHGIREAIMEATNKVASLGVDPTPLLALTRFTDLRDRTQHECRLPTRCGEADDMDALLDWHIRTSELFLIKARRRRGVDGSPDDDEGAALPNFAELLDSLATVGPTLPHPRVPIRKIYSILSAKMCNRQTEPTYTVMLGNGKQGTVKGHAEFVHEEGNLKVLLQWLQERWLYQDVAGQPISKPRDTTSTSVLPLTSEPREPSSAATERTTSRDEPRADQRKVADVASGNPSGTRHTAERKHRASGSPEVPVPVQPVTAIGHDRLRPPSQHVGVFSSWPCDIRLIRSIVSWDSMQDIFRELRDVHLCLQRSRGEERAFACTDQARRNPVSLTGLANTFTGAVNASLSCDHDHVILKSMTAMFSLKVMRGHAGDLCQMRQHGKLELLLSQQLLTYFYLQVNRWNELHGPIVAGRLWSLLSVDRDLDEELTCVRDLAKAIFSFLSEEDRPGCLELSPDVLRPLFRGSCSPMTLDVPRSTVDRRDLFLRLFLQSVHATLVGPFLPPDAKRDGIEREMLYVNVQCQLASAFATQTGSMAFSLTRGWQKVLEAPMSVYVSREDRRRPRLCRYSKALAGDPNVTLSLRVAIEKCVGESLECHALGEHASLATTVLDYHRKVTRFLETGVDFALSAVDAPSGVSTIAVRAPNLAEFWVFLRAMSEWLVPSERAPHAMREILHYFSTGKGPFVARHKEDVDTAVPLRSESPGIKLFLRAVMGTSKLTSKDGISYLLWWCSTGQGWKTRDFCAPIGFPSDHEAIWASLCRWTKEDGPCDNTAFLGWTNTAQSFTGLGTFCCDDVDRAFALPRVRGWFDPELQREWLEWLGEDADDVLSASRTPRKTWMQGFHFVREIASKHVHGLNHTLAFAAVNLLSCAGITSPCSMADVDGFVSKNGHSATLALHFLELPVELAVDRRTSFRFLYHHLGHRLSVKIRESIRFSPDSLLQALMGFARFITLHKFQHKTAAFRDLEGAQKLAIYGRELAEDFGADFLCWDESDILDVYGRIPSFLALRSEHLPVKRKRVEEALSDEQGRRAAKTALCVSSPVTSRMLSDSS